MIKHILLFLFCSTYIFTSSIRITVSATVVNPATVKLVKNRPILVYSNLNYIKVSRIEKINGRKFKRVRILFN